MRRRMAVCAYNIQEIYRAVSEKQLDFIGFRDPHVYEGSKEAQTGAVHDDILEHLRRDDQSSVALTGFKKRCSRDEVFQKGKV